MSVKTCGDCLIWQNAAADKAASKTAVCPIVKGRKHKLARACEAFREPEADAHECQCCGSEYCSCTDCIKAGKDTCGDEEIKLQKEAAAEKKNNRIFDALEVLSEEVDCVNCELTDICKSFHASDCIRGLADMYIIAAGRKGKRNSTEEKL